MDIFLKLFPILIEQNQSILCCTFRLILCGVKNRCMAFYIEYAAMQQRFDGRVQNVSNLSKLINGRAALTTLQTPIMKNRDVKKLCKLFLCEMICFSSGFDVMADDSERNLHDTPRIYPDWIYISYSYYKASLDVLSN